MARGNPVDNGLGNWDADEYPPVEHADTVPLKMTVNQPVKIYGATGLLSSQEWSGQFYRYLTPAFQHAADTVQGRVNWWHVRHVVQGLQQRGLTAIGASRSMKPRHLEALLAIRLQGLSWDVAEARYQCTKGQLGRLEARIVRCYSCYPAA